MRNEILRLPRRFLFLFFAGSCILIAALYHNGPVKGQTAENAQNAVSQNTVSGKPGPHQSSPSLIVVPNGMAVVTSTALDGPTIRLADISQFGPLWTNPSNYAPNYIGNPIQMPLLNSWTPSQFNDSLGDQVMRGLAISADGMKIYTGTSGYIGLNKTPNVYRIGPTSTTPLLLSTLPSYVADPTSRRGIAGLDLDETHNLVFASNYADGIIYRIDAITPGAPIDSFDPLNPFADSASHPLPPLGERVVALAYHKLENRLYYSIWGVNHHSGIGTNTIRSIGLTAAGAFDIPTDRLEFNLTGGISSVADIEFNNAGNRMLVVEEDLVESGGIINLDAHAARALEYIGISGAWSIDPITYGISPFKYNVGGILNGHNCRGGVAWAYANITGSGIISGNEAFVVFTGDALRFDTVGVYGLQFTPSTGAAPGTA